MEKSTLNFRIRIAEPKDIPFLREMLFQSLYVRKGDPPFERSILDEPSMRKYIDHWGRKGDVGVIAEDHEGKALGSAYVRLFPEHDQGYGSVAPDVPELGMALTAESRGRGIGAALLEYLLDLLKSQGVKRVSLSVDPDNEPAMRLYQRFGFQKVGEVGTSITMVTGEPPIILSLRPAPYQALSEGSKKHEFRRRFPDAPTEAFLYLSAPVSSVVAYAKFGKPIIATPEQLAELAENDEAGTYAGTLEYFKGATKGYALPLLELQPIKPMPLTVLRDQYGFRPPLSYRRVEQDSELERELRSRLHQAK
ncbi:GNAT family N-acetyltransferase [Saccharibacillus sp. JS10]|uniref:GNAT family N-acetyltransferase n=1 Tax=Saccharibacillus sp. JS10 TaxID=2950552 RepID=UPI00210C577A|nr:GNAT family N-acetyltransferase [Saccharibacillus sp. JS10]MCQ4088370.1 GNAT family N-acetyltransferase [Saccharibacillus sp. JS10]